MRTKPFGLKDISVGRSILFGESVSMSADGLIFVAGAPGESSNATGINDGTASSSGACYVFRYGNMTFTRKPSAVSAMNKPEMGRFFPKSYLKSHNADAFDKFGGEVAVSNDGRTFAVGALSEDSSETGVNASGFDNSAPSSGAVYIFEKQGHKIVQQAYLKV